MVFFSGLLLGGCQTEEECYHEINEIFNCLELNQNIDLNELIGSKYKNEKTIPIQLQKALVFYNEVSQNLPQYVQNRDLSCIKEVFELNSKFKLESAKILADSMLSSGNLNEKFPLEQFFLEARFTRSVDTSHLRFIKSINPEELSKVDLYYLLKSILILSNKPESELDLKLNLALINYGLYLFNTVDKADNFKKLKAEYFLRQGITLKQQSEDYFDLCQFSFEKARLLYKEINVDSYVQLTEWYLFGHVDINHSKWTTNRLGQLDLLKKYKIPLSLDIGQSLHGEKPAEAIKFYKFALSELKNINCNKLKNITINYIGLTYYELDQIDSTLHYFNMADNYKDCLPRSQAFFEYINLLLQTDIYAYLDKSNSRGNILARLEREKEVAKEIMHGDHFVDYKVTNALKVLNLFDKVPLSNKLQINRNLDLLNITTIRSQNIHQKNDFEKERKAQNIQKANWLKELNEFKDTTKYNNIIYKNLLNLMIEEYDPSPKLKPITSTFSPTTLTQKINNNQTQLLGFLAFDGDYIAYHLSNQGLNIYDIPSLELDTAFSQFSFCIEENEETKSSLYELQQLLLPREKINPKIPIAILPDAALNFLPWHLLFTKDQQVIQSFDMRNVANWDTTFIDPFKTSIFSYSDDETNASLTLRKLEELYSGFIEAKGLAKILNLDPSNLKAGKEFTKPALFDAFDGDLIHISSHSSTNMNNRLDNYIVLRDVKGQPDSVYAYELEATNESPKVVILSACDTGIGAYKNGTGAYSISRSFAQNGALAIIKSLWEVNDKSTMEFMSLLYLDWKNGLSLGQALDKTRDHFENELKSHPYFWAGFVLEGNPNIYFSPDK